MKGLPRASATLIRVGTATERLDARATELEAVVGQLIVNDRVLKAEAENIHDNIDARDRKLMCDFAAALNAHTQRTFWQRLSWLILGA